LSGVQLSRSSLRAIELPAYPGIALADVILVASEDQADTALKALLGTDVIGFDTESKPTFLKGEVSTGPHLVQLATDTHAYLFPISWTLGHAVLKTILESPLVQKIGFGLGNDRTVLRTRLGIDVHNLTDMGEILRGPGHRGTVGAKVAVAHFFGQKLQKHKRIGTSNWANRRLTAQQQLYAANDAQVALRVYRAWRETRETQEAQGETLDPPPQGLD
jgi:RNA polymerase sigma factor for flagellar operon FliA